MPIEPTPIHAIHAVSDDSLHTGELEVAPEWLAGLFGLRYRGEVRVMLGKIYVSVQHPTLRPGQIVVGTLATAFVPTGWSVRE